MLFGKEPTIHKRKYKSIGWHRLCGGEHNSPKDAVWFWSWVTCEECLNMKKETKQEERIRLLEERIVALESNGEK